MIGGSPSPCFVLLRSAGDGALNHANDFPSTAEELRVHDRSAVRDSCGFFVRVVKY
jgi:hypothetical protein